MKNKLFKLDFISIYVIAVLFFCSIVIKYSIDEILSNNSNSDNVYGWIRIIAAVCGIISHIVIINKKRLNELQK